MQEEIEERTVAISLTTARLSARALAVCFRELLAFGKKEAENGKSPPYKGKRSVSRLLKESNKVKTADLNLREWKEFRKTAAKYGLCYAIRKDPTKKDTYTLFFKSKDKKILKAFFKEYSEKILSPERIKNPLEEKINLLNRQIPQRAPVPEKRRELSR